MSIAPEILALPQIEILTRASAALGKVDLWGRRGVTMLSADACEAVVLLLAQLGLLPTMPGKPPTEAFFPTPETMPAPP